MISSYSLFDLLVDSDARPFYYLKWLTNIILDRGKVWRTHTLLKDCANNIHSPCVLCDPPPHTHSQLKVPSPPLKTTIEPSMVNMPVIPELRSYGGVRTWLKNKP